MCDAIRGEPLICGEPFTDRIRDSAIFVVTWGHTDVHLVKRYNHRQIAWIADACDVLDDEVLTRMHDRIFDQFSDGPTVNPGLYICNLDEFGIHLDPTVFEGTYLEPFDHCGETGIALDLTGFPRFWELFGFLLPRRKRDRVFTPAYQDLLADYLTTRKERYRTPWARRWLNFCFTFRTFSLVLQCCKVTSCGIAFAVLLHLIPPAIKEWCRDCWLNLFR